jgi:membrane associated rhomboid family serine protease
VHVLYRMGGMDAGSPLLGQVWRLWTYQFLHFGGIHIFFNMMALLTLGPSTEDVYGPSRTLVLYWLAGIGAGITSLFMKLLFFAGVFGQRILDLDPHELVGMSPTVGASGSIFGLIGLLIGHSIRRGGSQGSLMRRQLIQWAVYGFVMGFMIHADNAAHLGGLATGFVLGLIVTDRRLMGHKVIVWRVAAFTVVGLIAFGFAACALFRLTEPPRREEGRLERVVPSPPGPIAENEHGKTGPRSKRLDHRILPAGTARLRRPREDEAVALVEFSGGDRTGQNEPRPAEPPSDLLEALDQCVAVSLPHRFG